MFANYLQAFTLSALKSTGSGLPKGSVWRNRKKDRVLPSRTVVIADHSGDAPLILFILPKMCVFCSAIKHFFSIFTFDVEYVFSCLYRAIVIHRKNFHCSWHGFPSEI